jgi:hypothetical protein
MGGRNAGAGRSLGKDTTIRGYWLIRAALREIDGDDGANATRPPQWARQDADNECVKWLEQQSWCEFGMTVLAGHGNDVVLVPSFSAA